jgi:hypothetical protein
MGEAPRRIGTRAGQSKIAQVETPHKSGRFDADHRGDQEKMATSEGCGKNGIGESGDEESAGRKRGVTQRPRRYSAHPSQSFSPSCLSSTI